VLRVPDGKAVEGRDYRDAATVAHQLALVDGWSDPPAVIPFHDDQPIR
jgi:hypothetical protein